MLQPKTWEFPIALSSFTKCIPRSVLQRINRVDMGCLFSQGHIGTLRSPKILHMNLTYQVIMEVDFSRPENRMNSIYSGKIYDRDFNLDRSGVGL